MGQTQEAVRDFKHLLLAHPLSPEAEIARARLTALGAESSLTTAELRSLGDAYYAGGRYTEASEQYRALAKDRNLDAGARNGFAVAAAACDLKLKRLTTAQAEALADTQDENGARRLYLLMELARNRNDLDEQQRIVARMESSFPQSPWLAEALYSSGNMYLLRREYSTAVEYYSYLATHFPSNTNAAAAHWRAGWLSYRQGLYADAARLFDEQIRLYPGAKETVSALYWRGRLYETQDHKPAHGGGQLPHHHSRLPALFLCADGPPAAGRAGQCAARGAAATGPLPAAAGAAAGRELSRRQPASGQGAPAGQRGPERLHRPGDCRRSGLLVVERAGRGADLRLLWRDLSRHARAEAGAALRRHGVHQVHSAGLLAHPLSRSPGGRRSRPSRPRTISIPTWWPR